MLEEEAVVERNGQPPGEQAPGRDQNRDIEADDVADSEQGGRKSVAEECDAAFADEALGGESLRQRPQARGNEFEYSAGHGGEPENFGSGARIRAHLQHFGGRDAFGKAQLLFDDQRTAQRHRKQHAEQAAESDDGQGPPVVEGRPVMQKDECGQGEDRAGGYRRAGGGTGCHDVVLENIRAPEQGQYRHRNDGGRNRRGHRDPGEQTHIGIRGCENDREDDGEKDGLECQLRCRACAIGHCMFPMSFFTGRLRISSTAPKPTAK